MGAIIIYRVPRLACWDQFSAGVRVHPSRLQQTRFGEVRGGRVNVKKNQQKM